MQSITKINLKGTRDTEIILDDTENEKLPKKEKVNSKPSKGGGARHQEFSEAIAAYVPLVLKHFGFSDDFIKRSRIKTIEFKHDEKMGLSIRPVFAVNYVGVISRIDDELGKINGSEDLKLPYVHEDKKGTGFNKMPEPLQQAANNVLKEAQAFLEGKFAQDTLPFGEKTEGETDDEEYEGMSTHEPSDSLGSVDDDFKSSQTQEEAA